MSEETQVQKKIIVEHMDCYNGIHVHQYHDGTVKIYLNTNLFVARLDSDVDMNIVHIYRL